VHLNLIEGMCVPTWANIYGHDNCDQTQCFKDRQEGDCSKNIKRVAE